MSVSHECWEFVHSECDDDDCTCYCHEDAFDDDVPEWGPDVVVADTRGLL